MGGGAGIYFCDSTHGASKTASLLLSPEPRGASTALLLFKCPLRTQTNSVCPAISKDQHPNISAVQRRWRGRLVMRNKSLAGDLDSKACEAASSHYGTPMWSPQSRDQAKTCRHDGAIARRKATEVSFPSPAPKP